MKFSQKENFKILSNAPLNQNHFSILLLTRHLPSTHFRSSFLPSAEHLVPSANCVPRLTTKSALERHLNAQRPSPYKIIQLKVLMTPLRDRHGPCHFIYLKMNILMQNCLITKVAHETIPPGCLSDCPAMPGHGKVMLDV